MNKTLYSLLKFAFRNKRITSPIDFNNVKKMLILRYDAIGDMIVTTPLFEILKNKNPDLQLDILCSKKNYNIIEFNPKIDNIYFKPNNLFTFIKTIILLRKQRYDLILALVFNRTTESGIISNLIGGKGSIKVSVSHSDRNHFYYSLFNLLINLEDVRFTQTMAEIQVILISRLFHWAILKEEIQQRIYLNSSNKTSFKFPIKCIFFNVSAGRKEKEIDVENNIGLIKRLRQKCPEYSILLHISPNDYYKLQIYREKFIGQSQIVYLPEIRNILDICKIINLCEIVYSPDTSIIHIAATYKKKVIVLIPQNHQMQKEWLPYGTEYEIIKFE